jgi:hypothetical protein
MCLGRTEPAFPTRILRINFVVSQKQMIGVYAPAIVARMTKHRAEWNFPFS